MKEDEKEEYINSYYKKQFTNKLNDEKDFNELHYRCRLCENECVERPWLSDATSKMEYAQQLCRRCTEKGLEYEDILKYKDGTPVGMVYIQDEKTRQVEYFEYMVPFSGIDGFGHKHYEYRITRIDPEHIKVNRRIWQRTWSHKSW